MKDLIITILLALGVLFVWVGWGSVAIDVARDARKRGMKGWAWGLAVFLGGPTIWFIYRENRGLKIEDTER